MNDQTKHDGQQRLPNPVAWVRFCSDGGIEGPILDSDSRMDGVRRTSGAWTPLYTAKPAPVNQQTLAALKGYAAFADFRRRWLGELSDEMEAVDAAARAAIAAAEAAQPAVVMDERKAFEAFADEKGLDLERDGESYYETDTHFAWEAWELRANHPAIAQPVAVPDGARHWAYRRYGSEPQKGYTIVSRAAGATHGGTPVAYLGDGELAGDAVQAICEAHNAAFAAVAVPDEIDPDKAPWAPAEMEPDIAYADGWNACRAAMLSAAQKGGAA